MTHELAKELKDAAFPQPKYGEKYLWISEKHYVENKLSVHRLAHWKKLYTLNAESFVNEWLSIPTLSELITACGACFDSLAKKDYWVVEGHSLNKKPDWRYHNDPYEAYTALGSTPEEAVANLWLMLNKKTAR